MNLFLFFAHFPPVLCYTEHMHMIKVIPNFIDEELIDPIIKYIDENQEKLTKSKTQKRFQLKLGRDLWHDDSYTDLSLLGPLEDWIVKTYWPKVIDTIKALYNEDSDLYVASFWLAKQISGAVVSLHEDTDSGYNTHFKWSGILYLNEVPSGGVLEFPNLDYKHLPKRGDLLLFPSFYGGEYAHEVKEIYNDRYSMPIWITEDKSFDLSEYA